jgi:hypothetical protein
MLDVADLAELEDLRHEMQICWLDLDDVEQAILTIGYRVQQAPRQFVVCDKYRSFVINVQGGSRDPIPNK